ncbi:MAG: indole-3-glycerol phosphate synthase TrpC [Clostridiales bacterium]|nr:indole-3-glycerol phosphate synthase TrpC [Clostridiales bacterium]
MDTILDRLAAHARERVQADKAKMSLDELKRLCAKGAAPKREPFAFETALRKPGLSFICEIKKASPSKGVISEAFPYLDIAREYEAAGADCISCLTEPKWFLGSDRIFSEVRAVVDVPMLRKDFTVDEYQIYQAKRMGADAVLLLCALLDGDAIRRYLALCDALGLSALVEAYDAAELNTAIETGARVIGVNNRNLKDFSVDTGNSGRLRAVVPAGVLFVSESGVRSAEDVRAIAESGADAVLIGETLMREPDKKAMLDRFRGAL